MISEIFLIIDDASERGASLTDALAPLETSPERPRCLWARVYYRSETGAALIHLCFPSVSPRQLRWLGRACDDAAVLLLAPSLLTAKDQDRFYREVLGLFERRFGPFRSVAAATDALVRELHPVDRRRADTEWSATPAFDRVDAEPPGGASASIASVTPAPAPAPARHPPPPTRARRLGSQGEGTGIDESPPIDVRFRRGDEWAPGRLRQLSAKGAFVTTSTLPQLRELVHLALRFGEHRVRLQAAVSRRHPPENGGDIGFGASFFGMNAAQQEGLVALLRAAQAEGVALTPPPERAAARFPVRWPMRFTSSRGLLTLPALDLSRSGLFVGGGDRTLGEEVSFLMPHDGDEGPLAGHAAVARIVDSTMAESRGLHRGVGVQITRLDGVDGRRYAELIGRVRRRATKHVVVCARGARARGLSASLASVGYAVSTGDDPDALENAWSATDHVPAVAVFDSSVPRGLGAVHLERMWRRRSVLCVSTNDEAPKAIRITVDRSLQIARTG